MALSGQELGWLGLAEDAKERRWFMEAAIKKIP